MTLLPGRMLRYACRSSPYSLGRTLRRGRSLSVGRKHSQQMDQRVEKGHVFVTLELSKLSLEPLLQSRHDIEVSTWEGSSIPREELLQKVQGVHGICSAISAKIDKELLDVAGPQLKVVSNVATGYDNVDVEELRKRGIKLGNTPDVLTDATAEIAVALAINAGRRLFEANLEARSGGWGNWNLLWMCGSGLSNSTVGIVGLGKIGLGVAKRMLPFNVRKILYVGRREKVQEAAEVGAQFVTLDELLQQSDFVIVTCALNSETKGLFNKAAFQKMKKSAIFVNVSRGAVVEQDDLVEALQNGTIQAAGLDVTTPEPLPTDHTLFKLRNCVVLPHVGSAEVQTRNAMANLAIRNLLAALDGETYAFPSSLRIRKIEMEYCAITSVLINWFSNTSRCPRLR